MVLIENKLQELIKMRYGNSSNITEVMAEFFKNFCLVFIRTINLEVSSVAKKLFQGHGPDLVNKDLTRERQIMGH